MPLADGATFAGYVIVRMLGSGGMGEVYLAQHPRLPRHDALKVLPESVSADGEYRERFNREADMAAALWHPHIVGVHDRGDVDGQLWISMDYVEGTDAACLQRERYPNGMPKQQVADIIAAVADALDYAHQRNLLHRDVKPSNILLAHPESEDQRILLADFGIARWADDISGLTGTNMTVGTVSYAAPEQLMGGVLDGRADQYALAATAFHLLTGTPPFGGSNAAVVISQHLSASPPGIETLRPELAALDPLLSKALAKDPDDRFERCADFARALSDQLQAAPSDDGGATRLSGPAVRDSWQRHRKKTRSLLRPAVIVPAILGVLLVIAILAAVFEAGRADEAKTTAPKTPTATTAESNPPAPPPPPSPSPTTTTTTTSAAAAPVAVIGADCSPVGSTGTTKNGSTAYCSTLQSTGASIWSLNQGDIPSPTITPEPTETPIPFGGEPPVRVCMEQTGQTRRACRDDIRASNGLPPLP